MNRRNPPIGSSLCPSIDSLIEGKAREASKVGRSAFIPVMESEMISLTRTFLVNGSARPAWQSGRAISVPKSIPWPDF